MFEQGDIDWNNHANDYENMIGGVYDLDQAVRAAEAYVESGENDMDWSNTLIIVTSDHSNSYLKSNEVLGEGNLPLQEGSPYNFTYPDGEVSYSTTGHTNELVTLQARGAGAELFAEYEGQWYEGSDIVDNTQIYDVMREAAFQEGAEHVILFIGDGMNVEHEVAASRYLYGTDQGLAWDDWGVMEDGWSGYASTWDVDTYNHYAEQRGAAPYSQESFDPLIGYDPSRGGDVAFPLNSEVSAAFEGDTIAPAVESFAPADGEVDVLPDSDIVVTFNEIIQRGSGTIEIREGSADGDLVESYDAATSQNLDFDGDTLTIDPTADLVEDTEFFITFADGSVLDLSGNGYEGTEEYNFTTDAVEAAFAATSDDSGSSTGVVLAGIGIVGILAFAL